MIKKSLLLGALLFMTLQASAQMIAARTDLVKDAAMIPNLGIDLVVGDRHTLGVDVFLASKPWGKDVSMVGFTPHFRYWLSGRPFSRLFVGLTAQLTNYDIKWDGEVFQGNAVSAGVALGYVFNLSKRFNLELACGTDLAAYSHKNYYFGDLYDHYGEKANEHGTRLMPRLEFSLVYVIR